MKYYITDYKNQEAKESLRCLGLYCYSLRSKDNTWNEIATIENNVLINCYGSIITNEKIKLGKSYPDDFLDFSKFEQENEKVSSIASLRDDLEYVKNINLSDDKNIEMEFFNQFEDSDEFENLDKMGSKQKYKYFIKYFEKLSNYQLVDKGGHIYELFHVKGEQND